MQLSQHILKICLWVTNKVAIRSDRTHNHFKTPAVQDRSRPVRTRQ